jgi:RNA polymerase sigma-70 factor (ECF subfamily)
MRSAGRSPEDVTHADEVSLDTKRETERLRDAMAQLTPEHRAIVVLRFEAELSLEEIARELQLELGTVKSRLSRAREALRSAVRPRESLAEGT